MPIGEHDPNLVEISVRGVDAHTPGNHLSKVIITTITSKREYVNGAIPIWV